MLVIIHGWRDNHGSFKRLADRLAEAGLARKGIAEINLGDYLSLDDKVTFNDLVDALDRAWTFSRRKRSADVIVHSTGALVVRDWLTQKFSAEHNPVRRLLMLAPANFGSPVAHTGRSVVGRAVLGWGGSRVFETGAHLLKGLELASPYSAGLAERDLFGNARWYGADRILATTLVGNSGYSGIRAVANKPGSDGTVRVATANLNAARLDLAFPAGSGDPEMRLRQSAGQSAFGVMDGEDHSTVALKRRGPKDSATFEWICGALKVTGSTFEEWCNRLSVHTAAVMERRNAESEASYHHGFQNTVVRVTDQYGADVDDYVVELYVNDDAGRRAQDATRRIQEEVIRNVHAYRDNSAWRSFLMNCNILRRILGDRGDRLYLSVTANPDIRRREVGYRTFNNGDIGALTMDRAAVDRLFVDNRTLFVNITLRREQSAKVFRFVSY